MNAPTTERELRDVPISEFNLSAQTRSGTRRLAVVDYAGRLADGKTLAPGVAYFDGEVLFLASGFHRREAYIEARRSAMPCCVRKGSRWDAIKFGIEDNQKFLGERVSNADKRAAVIKVLLAKHEQSNSWIAELCGVDDKTVAKNRWHLEGTSEIPKSSSRIGKDGRDCKIPERTGTMPPSPADAGKPERESELGPMPKSEGQARVALIDPDDGRDAIEQAGEVAPILVVPAMLSPAAPRASEKLYSIGLSDKPVTMLMKKCQLAFGAALRAIDELKKEIGSARHEGLEKLIERAYAILNDEMKPEPKLEPEINF